MVIGDILMGGCWEARYSQAGPAIIISSRIALRYIDRFSGCWTDL